MASAVWDISGPALTSVREQVDAQLADFVSAQEQEAPGPEMAPLFATARRNFSSPAESDYDPCSAWRDGKPQDHREIPTRSFALLPPWSSSRPSP